MGKAATASRSVRRRMAAWALGPDVRRRRASEQALLALLLMAVSVSVLAYAAHAAGTATVWIVAWAMLSLGGLGLAWWAIRGGYTQRRRDPALTVPQMLFSITSGAVGYTLAGPLRGIVFPALMVVLMFGMFRLSALSAALVSAYALFALGVAMAFKAATDPQVYAATVEWGHFAMLAAMLPAVALLTARLARLRGRERRQRHKLQQALAHIQELATHDELTGLVNRRHMTHLLEQEHKRSARSGQPFAIALVDIDHFKGVNDQLGHAVGDEVLRNLARQMPLALRSTDIVARWGGEEFLVLLPDTKLATARIGLERLRGRAVATPMAFVSGEPIRITLSAGLVECPADESPVQAIARADRALYDAKSQGRNRVVCV
jgi:diguanylate cyclase (GGDEF)-like protein